ncbi:MAG: VTT domain-containing protein [Alphaproteobacteria bacterium]|nr:VTT domain-containing protein [Alphaproteobacteria bacterium]
MGLPLPGETMLITAAIYAGATHQLGIVLVVLAAAFGAILGDNAGFWVGRRLGFLLLRRYGHFVGIDEQRLKLGRYLFARHGGKVVFFGRFTALLRALAALLAGANGMQWRRFLLSNLAGGVLWAMFYGGGGYLLGGAIQRIAAPVGIGLAVLAAAAMVAGALFLRHHEGQLAARAERAFPGPLGPPARPGVR